MKLTVRGKLFAGFGLVLVLLISIGMLGSWYTRQLVADLEGMYQTDVKAAIHLSLAERALWELRFSIGNYPGFNEEQRAKIKADTPKWRTQLEENIKAYGVSVKSAEERELLTTWQTAMTAYFEARPKFFELVDAGKLEEAKEFRKEKTNPPAAQAVAAAAKVIALHEKSAEGRYAHAVATARRSAVLVLLLSLSAVALGAGLAWAISQSIVRPLRRTVDSLALLSDGEGDLTRRLDDSSQDELGDLARAFNRFVEQLSSLLLQVREAAVHATTAAGELSSATDELSSGSQEQAASLEETAASLEEITATVKQNADNAQQANQLASASRDVAEKGGGIVIDAVKSMDEINSASRKIADIITTIDEIAFQTNLLALNAAVEAARAGEQGRGFAVVAAEVRNLAQRSAAAAKEIKGLIHDSVGKVDAGSKLVNASGQALEEIVASVKRVTDIVGEIAAASAEQSAGIEQVNRAVAQMDGVVQSSAAQGEQLSSTAEALATHADQLQSLIGRFKLQAGSGGARPVPARRPAPQVPPRTAPAATNPAAASRPALPPDARARRRMRATDEVVRPEEVAVVAATSGNGHARSEQFDEF